MVHGFFSQKVTVTSLSTACVKATFGCKWEVLPQNSHSIPLNYFKITEITRPCVPREKATFSWRYADGKGSQLISAEQGRLT